MQDVFHEKTFNVLGKEKNKKRERDKREMATLLKSKQQELQAEQILFPYTSLRND